MLKMLARLLVLCCALFAGVTWTQSFPSKPIRIVLSYTHGGPVDLLARAVGEKVSARLGQPVLVESRAGASASRPPTC